MTDPLVYVLCAMRDIPSQKGRAFELLTVDSDGQQKPWPIFVVRWGKHVFGYRNRCPHDMVALDWERNQFFDPNSTRLMCGKHGALFDLTTGECVEGPCLGQGLEPVPLLILDDDICVAGVALVEDEEEASG